jgi:hypothetical protein
MVMHHPVRGLLIGPLVVAVFGLPIAYAAALLWGAPVLYARATCWWAAQPGQQHG